MGRSFATFKKDMAPKLKEIDLKMEIEDLKRERDEQKKEREKAIGNEQQKFRNELTNKMSLIESLKKKLIQFGTLNLHDKYATQLIPN